MNHKAKNETGRILGALTAFLLCALVLLVLGAWIAGLSGLGERGLAVLSGAIQFFCALSAAAVLRRGEGSAMALGLICATCCAALSLTLGFLIDSERVCLPGLLRVLLTSLGGALVGARLPARKRSGKGRRGLAKIKAP